MSPSSRSPGLSSGTGSAGAAAAGLDVVVVHHRTPAALLDDALSRLAVAAPEAEVVLVDTANDEELRPSDRWPRRLEVLASANHSYSHAVNVGAARLASRQEDARRPRLRHLVIMNADVLVERDTFARLRAALDSDPRAGVVGPLALTREGRPQDLGLPYRLVYALAARAGARGVEAPWLSGCLQLVDRELFERLGGYDESLRFTNEDLDFCLRVRRAGRRCRLVAAPVVHVGGASTPDDPSFHVEGRRGGYVITRRYRSKLFAFLHRGFLRAEALLGSRFAGDEGGRARHAAMARWLARGEWERSPFGATLDDRPARP